MCAEGNKLVDTYGCPVAGRKAQPPTGCGYARAHAGDRASPGPCLLRGRLRRAQGHPPRGRFIPAPTADAQLFTRPRVAVLLAAAVNKVPPVLLRQVTHVTVFGAFRVMKVCGVVSLCVTFNDNSPVLK